MTKGRDWVAKITDIYFLTVLEVGSLPAALGSGEDPLPGLQKAAFQLCIHMAFLQGLHVERESLGVSS